jgi:hypothetical protein
MRASCFYLPYLLITSRSLSMGIAGTTCPSRPCMVVARKMELSIASSVASIAVSKSGDSSSSPGSDGEGVSAVDRWAEERFVVEKAMT